MGLVTIKEGNLWMDGHPFRFIGTNCYFLQEEGAREVMGWEGYSGRLEEAMQKVSGLGLSVVRAWACNDDPQNPAAIQPAPLDYNEWGLRGMDLVIATAARYGVKLILSLCNYWNDYGGVPQYLVWHGLSPSEPQQFFVNSAVVSHYEQHIERLLSRVNTYTGIVWGHDPTILAWELMNEPRGKGLADQGESMSRWVRTMTDRIHRSAPNHLVSTGEEGLGDDLGREGLASDDLGSAWMTHQTGQNFSWNSQEADLASIHLYPENWGWHPDRIPESGCRWILERAEIASKLGKPLIVGEFGLPNHGRFNLDNRRRIYDTWVNAAFAHPAVAGLLSWSFSTDDRPDDWDDFGWTWKAQTRPEDPKNRYADLHRDWARLVGE